MTDPGYTNSLPALCHELLEREARLERLLEQLLECGCRPDKGGPTHGARATSGGAVAQGPLLGRSAKPAVGSRSGYSR